MSTHWDVCALVTTSFMVFAVLYWVTHPVPLARGLSRPQLAFTACLLAVGVATFFIPVAHTDPAVGGKNQWSTLDLWFRICAGKLRLSLVAMDMGITYILMLISAVIILFPKPRKALLIVSLSGVVCSSWALEMGRSE